MICPANPYDSYFGGVSHPPIPPSSFAPGLKRQWSVHTRDGLLFCNSCGREFSQSQGQGHANEILSDDHFDCDKCNNQFPDIESLYEHKARDHGTSYQCDVCKELEAREATGIGYICCVCDAEFEIATKLEDHMSMHDNVLFG